MNCTLLHNPSATLKSENIVAKASSATTSLKITRILQSLGNNKTLNHHTIKMPLKWHHHTPMTSESVPNKLSTSQRKRSAKRAERQSSGLKRTAAVSTPYLIGELSVDLKSDPLFTHSMHDSKNTIITVPLDMNSTHFSNAFNFSESSSESRTAPLNEFAVDCDNPTYKTEFPGVGVIPLSEAFEELENRVKSSNETILNHDSTASFIYNNDPFLTSATRRCNSKSTVEEGSEITNPDLGFAGQGK